MKEETGNLGVVQRAYEAFGRGDIPALLGVLAEDIDWIQPGPVDLIPTAGCRSGKPGVAAYFQSVGDTFDIEAFEPKQFVAQGETVIVLGHYRRRVKATGLLDESDWVHVFTVRDGLIARHQAFADTAGTLAAFGARADRSGTVG